MWLIKRRVLVCNRGLYLLVLGELRNAYSLFGGRDEVTFVGAAEYHQSACSKEQWEVGMFKKNPRALFCVGTACIGAFAMGSHHLYLTAY